MFNELLELNSEILRSREMDYYRYHSFLNAINIVLEKQDDEKKDTKKNTPQFHP